MNRMFLIQDVNEAKSYSRPKNVVFKLAVRRPSMVSTKKVEIPEKALEGITQT